MTILAAIQLTSSDDISSNSQAIESLVAEAASKGASLAALPENAYFMRREARNPDEAGATTNGFTMETHPGVAHASGVAKHHRVWLLVGSIAVVEDGDTRSFNRSLLFNPHGELVQAYDKIHLFDVTLPDGQVYRESARIRPGAHIKTASTDSLTLGLTICYDLRFPEQYRALAAAGAEVIAVPSAFTVPTGKAHWETLLRARAIENGAYVIAPAQTGKHPGGRETYGHSLIINPWGEILADAGEAPGVITAEIDPKKAHAVRQQLGITYATTSA